MAGCWEASPGSRGLDGAYGEVEEELRTTLQDRGPTQLE